MSKGPIWESQSQIFIKVIVKPNSKSKKFVEEITDEFVVINLRDPAREGKANTELVKRLSKTLGISTSSVQIVRGHKSRDKTVVVDGIELDQVRTRLGR